MKTPLLAILACVLTSSSLRSAPNDSVDVRDEHRVEFNDRLPLASSVVRSSSIFFKTLGGDASTVSFQSSHSPFSQNSRDVGTQDDNSTESSPYLKPALFVAGALATTAILIRTDQTTYNVLHRWRMTTEPIGDVSPAITNLGDGRASMVIFGGLLAYSFIDKDNRAFQAGKIGLESFLVSGIATQILKHTFGRERPSTATRSGGRWNGSFLILNQGSGKRGGYAQYDAFPSGHTSTAFAAATTLAEVYHDSPWVSYASYSIASGVAISRVMERAHWLSDVFVGALIGYFGTKVVLHYNHTDNPIIILPTYDGTQMGLSLNVGL